MRRIVIAAMSTLSALVLVFSLDASRRGGDAVTAAPESGRSSSDSSGQAQDDGSTADGDGQTSDGQTSDGQTSDGQTTEGKAPTAAATSGTFTGDEAETRWGIVQVRIVVKNGKIVKAQAVKYPDENHKDQEINSWAVPQLEQATVESNGQGVDGYSGATVTSDGYRTSLQSAMDKAHL